MTERAKKTAVVDGVAFEFCIPDEFRGILLTFEGGDGAGKSGHVAAASQFFRDLGFDVVVTREPGGTPLGEKSRDLMLHEPMSNEAETLLAYASRAEHIAKVIKPALDAGKVVICDRYVDSTYVYQGVCGGYPVDKMDALNDLVVGDLMPSLTLYFDLAPEIAAQRLDLTGKDPDKFESRGIEYFDRVRKGYQGLVKKSNGRMRVIDSSPPFAEVGRSVLMTCASFLAGAFPVPNLASKVKP